MLAGDRDRSPREHRCPRATEIGAVLDIDAVGTTEIGAFSNIDVSAATEIGASSNIDVPAATEIGAFSSIDVSAATDIGAFSNIDVSAHPAHNDETASGRGRRSRASRVVRPPVSGLPARARSAAALGP
jgi:hypothetical protein